MEEFLFLPFFYCDAGRGCFYNTRTDKTNFLGVVTRERPTDHVYNEEVMPYISRCAVCEIENRALAFHSQSAEVPRCPTDQWAKLWEGYSFLMFTGSNARGGGQNLASPGSCMRHFSTVPFIECIGTQKSCYVFSVKYSYWLWAADEVATDFDTSDPTAAIYTRDQIPNQISRCVVCFKLTSSNYGSLSRRKRRRR
jgi:hypothetical protein